MDRANVQMISYDPHLKRHFSNAQNVSFTTQFINEKHTERIDAIIMKIENLLAFVFFFLYS